jgi:hypothetical protein
MCRTKLRRSTSASDSQVEKRQKKKQLNKSTVRLRDTTGIHGSSPTVATASSGDPSGMHRSTSFEATASLGDPSGIPRCPPTDTSPSSRDPSGIPRCPPTPLQTLEPLSTDRRHRELRRSIRAASLSIDRRHLSAAHTGAPHCLGLGLRVRVQSARCLARSYSGTGWQTTRFDYLAD